MKPMRNLLCANFSRLLHSHALWSCAALMAVSSLGLVLIEYQETYAVPLDRVVFQSLSVYGFIAAVFVSLFLGAEYGDGTMRNKLIIGCPRRDIYLANYVTTTAGCMILYLAAILPAAVLGILLFDSEAGPGIFLTAAGLGLLACLAYGGIYCIIAMLCPNKALTAVFCLFLSLILLFLAVFVNLRLAQPETIREFQGMELDQDFDITIIGDAVLEIVEKPNPYYSSGLKRQVFQFLQAFNPTGQAALLTTMEYSRPWAMAGSSLLLALLSCLGGILVFRRKDIK